jgi:Flp pilus assembly protein TadD
MDLQNAAVSGRATDRLGRRQLVAAIFLALATSLGACATSSETVERAPAQLDAADAPSRLRVADRMRAEGAYESALNVYRQAAVALPNQSAPRIGEGDVLTALGDYGQATEAYNAALRLEPKSAAALRGLAVALMRNGQPRLAHEPIGRLQQIAATDPRTYSLAGVAWDLEGDHAAAQAQYRLGLAQVPTDPGLSINLALSLALSGDFTRAEALLEAPVQRPEATMALRQNLALVYGLAGDRANATKIGRLDLNAAAVDNNLDYYETLRSMAPDVRARALLIAPAPGSGSVERL